MATWIKRHTSFVVFFIIVAICTSITLFAELRISSSFADEQNRIVKNYDALLSILSMELEDGMPAAIDSIVRAMGCDSVQEAILRDAYKQYIQPQTDRTVIDRTAQSARMVMEVRDVLDRQSSKIQQEYETLEVWCGIITVVFLIFSFYSLFKVEDIVNQGKAGLKELEEIKEKGNGKIDDFIKVTQSKTGQTIAEMVNKMAVQKSEFLEAATKEAKTKIEEETKVLDKYVADYISTVDTKSRDFDSSLNNKYQEIEQKHNQYKDSLEDMKKSMDVLKMKLESLAGSAEVIPSTETTVAEIQKKQAKRKTTPKA